MSFERRDHGAIDAYAVLDFTPGGLTVRIHETWGADKYLVSFARSSPGLEVTFECSLFHLTSLGSSFREYEARIYKRAQDALEGRPT
jgi:hypothetical protein